jgi:SnoaL-like domain
MVACMAPDVVFHSPVTFRPFLGREAVSVLFAALLDVFEDFAYIDEIEADGLHALVFRARVGERSLEGVDLLRTGDDGQVRDFTVMVRPMSGVIALAEAMGPRVASLSKA